MPADNADHSAVQHPGHPSLQSPAKKKAHRKRQSGGREFEGGSLPCLPCMPPPTRYTPCACLLHAAPEMTPTPVQAPAAVPAPAAAPATPEVKASTMKHLAMVQEKAASLQVVAEKVYTSARALTPAVTEAYVKKAEEQATAFLAPVVARAQDAGDKALLFADEKVGVRPHLPLGARLSSDA